ncbi:hypothetical protein HO173_008550 [Letharia columbiana]|uniref:Uncharacterized protein n=1 Tax=Letharia columbiana TaxID=112416 RepID=A0A8H6L2M1_9LECA|nr:uncharacterized protein HO173_008550 [Letharia columbiana]KAF6233260.1 hypothetical protein HO173_008550 [Letharia columbiana]
MKHQYTYLLITKPPEPASRTATLAFIDGRASYILQTLRYCYSLHSTTSALTLKPSYNKLENPRPQTETPSPSPSPSAPRSTSNPSALFPNASVLTAGRAIQTPSNTASGILTHSHNLASPHSCPPLP